MTNYATDYLKEYLTAYVERITTHSKGNMYVCPLCHSGEGEHRTGAFGIYDGGKRWKCFACHEEGDIFDLIGKMEHVGNFKDQANIIKAMFENNVPYQVGTPRPKSRDEKQQDYKDFFLSAHNHIAETDYPQRRGLSKETVERFKLGFVAEWRHPKCPNAPASPRLIIPTSSHSYLARDTRENIPPEQIAYSKSKVGSIQIFNQKALTEATKPIFVVEGEIDALSIIEVGGEAVALGSTTKSRDFLKLIKKQKPTQPIIIALDNDGAGERASEELISGLKELGVTAYKYNPFGSYKDANESLQKDREKFTRDVSEAEHYLDDVERMEREQYLKNSVANYLQSFKDGIGDKVNTRCIPTGFPILDRALDDGLYEGLYIVGAISSLGKTTLVTQIADQIAQSGQDVLIFSLEMARTELMSKSISRQTIQQILYNGGNVLEASTSREVTTGTKYAKYSEEKSVRINRAIDFYETFADKIYITEGIGDIGVEQIRDTVEKHIRYTGNVPVVVVDYLQILAPHSDRLSDKQNTDKAVLELKRISRDYKLPLIGISSFNRSNYKEAVTMEAFKESGAIEYSSDVLIGLQLKGAGKTDFDVNEAKRKSPREIELVILKNRNGQTGIKLEFKYYPQYNFFTED